MKNTNQFFFLLFVSLVVLSCGDASQNEEQQIREKSKPTVVITKPMLTKSEKLYKFLHSWSTAQSNGDYQEYVNCYGKDFSGIKRVGGNTYTYNYDDWLIDRKKMFRKDLTVKVSSVRIDTNVNPYKIFFDQYWSNGSFRDFGPKVLKVLEAEGEYKIVFEEMLRSTLYNFSGETANIRDRNNFYLRTGSYLLTDKLLESGDLIASEEFCQPNDFCFDIHKYAVVGNYNESILGRKVYYGDALLSNISESTIRQYCNVVEELKDSLRGIQLPYSSVEYSYSWPGYNSSISEGRSVIELSDTALLHGVAQWALVTDTIPHIYSPSDESINVESLKKEMNLDKYAEIGAYSDGNEILLVSYDLVDECGYEYYQNVALWEYVEGGVKLIKKLPDLPLLIFDLGKNGNLEMFYDSDAQFDYSNFVESESPNYGIMRGDTVFLGCGC